MAPKPTGNGTRIYQSKNVDQALWDRTEWLMDEFGRNVMVTISGGKDSTVILERSLEVARAKDLLPLKACWVDQEAEWQGTVDIQRSIMYRDEIEPIWLQIPFRITNATSSDSPYFHCWDPEAADRWIHERDPVAITENNYGTDELKKLFSAVQKQYWGDERGCSIGGVRAEESPNRRLGLTGSLAYKHATWGGVVDAKKEQYTFYPLYDWSYTDIWKAIHENEWPYNRIYNELFRVGKSPVRDMRISSLQHEMATGSLYVLQEFEPDVYERMVRRIGGIDMVSKLGAATYAPPEEVPFMFDSWGEYRDYLFHHLIADECKPQLRKIFTDLDRKLPDRLLGQSHAAEVGTVLSHDHTGASLVHWSSHRDVQEAIRANKENWKDPKDIDPLYPKKEPA